MLMAAKKDDDLIPPEIRRRNKYERVEVEDPQGRKSFGGKPIKTKVLRNLTQDPIDRYFQRGQITLPQWKAGRQLAADWFNGKCEPKMVTDTTAIRVDGGQTLSKLSDRQMDARQAFSNAMKAVGPIASNEVCQACCEHRPVGKGAGMELLRRGLDVLVKWYGY